MSAVAAVAEAKETDRSFAVREAATALVSLRSNHRGLVVACTAIEEFALSLDPPRREDARWLAGWRSDEIDQQTGLHDCVWGFGATADKAVADVLKRVWVKNANKG